MQIRVIFTNQSAGKVTVNSLEQMINNGQVAAYYEDQWISVKDTRNNTSSHEVDTKKYKSNSTSSDCVSAFLMPEEAHNEPVRFL